MKLTRYTFNFFIPIQLGASITLGMLGLVSWWIIGLIWLMDLKLEMVWNKR